MYVTRRSQTKNHNENRMQVDRPTALTSVNDVLQMTKLMACLARMVISR